MAYPHEHILIRFNGHFGTSGSIIDKWSSGLRFGLPTAAPAYDEAKLQTFVNACQAAANTFHSAASSITGTNAFLDYVTGAQIGALGRYSPQSQLTVQSPTVVTGGNGTPVLPWNSALVTSLRTAVPRGRGSNGRVYWPALAGGIQAGTGRLQVPTVQTRLNLMKTFFDACNTAADSYSAGMRLVVASAVEGGMIQTVTSIRADERVDSIERRENDQVSTWSTATLA